MLAGDFPKGRTFTANMFATWAEVHAIVSPTTRRHRMLCVQKFCMRLMAHVVNGTIAANLHGWWKLSGKYWVD